MHTVCETEPFQAAAKEADMAREEIDALSIVVGNDPTGGDMLVGTGGCRKIRYAKPGMGKRSGYRIITYFSGPDLPVFLLTVFGKGEKSNLTKGEKNSLATLTEILADTYRKKVVTMGAAR